MESNLLAVPNAVRAFPLRHACSFCACTASGRLKARRKLKYPGRFDPLQRRLAIVAVRCTGFRCHHPTTGTRKILGAKFRETDQFIAVGVAWVSRKEKCNVGILPAPRRNFV